MQMRNLAIGRHLRKSDKGFELRETQVPYNALFNAEKVDIGDKNRWFRNE
jgi:hypothetical protein